LARALCPSRQRNGVGAAAIATRISEREACRVTREETPGGAPLSVAQESREDEQLEGESRHIEGDA